MPSRKLGSLDQMIDGAVRERFEAAMEDVWANIFDPNTDPNAVRGINLAFRFKPNARRDAADQAFSITTKLAPPMPIMQTILIERHDDGSVTAMEYTSQLPGQIDMDGDVNIPRVIEFKSSTPQS